MDDTTLETLREHQQRMLEMPAQRAELIAAARSAGHSWRAIGEAMGMTEHGAIKASRPSGPKGRPRS